uniref:MFS domain-containing protein n=1 Tax=Meloidogyne hapla TaxID=6305 RepID=A0A1I8BCL9_MELHA
MPENDNNNQPNYSSLPPATIIQTEKRRLIIFEPSMLLFMFTSYAKFPVFQSLLFEKACLSSGRFDEITCQNISATHADLELQKTANHLLIASTLCLFLPSIPSALFLGTMFDSWSSRKTLFIPLIGLLFADFNYILQSICLDCSPYLLLFSDLIFGFTGGFTSIIGLLFAYSVRVTPTTFRPTRMALLEGSMGLGGMFGYFLSGQLRQRIGYSLFFLLLTILHLIVFIQIIFFCKELINKNNNAIITNSNSSVNLNQNSENNENGMETASTNFCILCRKRFLDILQIFKAERDVNKQKYLNIVLVALLVEFISYSGLMDILFSFLRFQLRWTDKEYGWFNGIDTGSASFCIIFIYPLLQKRIGISNLRLAFFGLLFKIGSVVILAFTTSSLIAFLSIFFSIFGRFVPTGLRAIASACKIFSLMSLLQSLGFLIASPFFNGIYPFTLHFFPGTMLLIVAALLTVPGGLLIYLDVKNKNLIELQ